MMLPSSFDRAHRGHGPAVQREVGLAGRFLGEVERAVVDRAADRPRELGVGVHLEAEERVVPGPGPLLPGVGVRRRRKEIRIERVREVPALPVVVVVDELRPRRLAVDDERSSPGRRAGAGWRSSSRARAGRRHGVRSSRRRCSRRAGASQPRAAAAAAQPCRGARLISAARSSGGRTARHFRRPARSPLPRARRSTPAFHR